MSLMTKMDNLHLQVIQFGKDVQIMRANYETHITELEAQLADAKQVSNDCRIVADNAISEALAAKKDAERLDWIIDNASSAGGGDGFTLKVFVPVDCECVRTAIDAAIAEGKA